MGAGSGDGVGGVGGNAPTSPERQQHQQQHQQQQQRRNSQRKHPQQEMRQRPRETIRAGGSSPMPSRWPTGCAPLGRRAGPATMTSPAVERQQRRTTGRRLAGVCLSSRRTKLVGALVYQIVIVSLVLHNFPRPDSSPVAKALELVGAPPRTQTFDQSAGLERQHQRRHSGDAASAPSGGPRSLGRKQTLIESAPSSPFYNPGNKETGEGTDQRQARAADMPLRNSGKREQASARQRQQTKAPATATTSATKMAEGENNGRRGAPGGHGELSLKDDEIKGGDMADKQIGRRRRAPAVAAERFKRSHMLAPRAADEARRQPAAANQYRRLADHQPSGAPDCQELNVLWTYLQLSYPTLLGHLARLAAAGEQAPAGSGGSDQLARSVGELLDDAERITAAVQRQQPASKQTQSTPSRHHHSPSWLTRLIANPTYARLVEHVRARQRQLANQRRPASAALLQSIELMNAGQGEAAPESSQDGDGDGDPAAGPARQSAEVYGRMIHYPHEIGRVDNSNGMARTLSKLHLLHELNKQQQRLLSSGDIVESNRIPTASDAEHMDEPEWPNLATPGANTAGDLARSDFVYGTMMLQPAGAGSSGPDLGQLNNHLRPDQSRHYGGPPGAQHEIDDEQERQRSRSPDDASGETSTGQPTSVGGANRARTTPANDNALNNDDNSNLRRLDAGESALAGTDSLAPDELTNLQATGQVAVDAGNSDGELLQLANNDEFEGEFHSSPLKQPEVRMLRSLSGHQGDQRHGAAREGPTPASTQAQVGLVAKQAAFVID